MMVLINMPDPQYLLCGPLPTFFYGRRLISPSQYLAEEKIKEGRKRGQVRTKAVFHPAQPRLIQTEGYEVIHFSPGRVGREVGSWKRRLPHRFIHLDCLPYSTSGSPDFMSAYSRDLLTQCSFPLH